jgi:predicted naringenin-chalcone synthase
MSRQAYVNRIATAVPAHDVHDYFQRFGASLLTGAPQHARIFSRMAERSGIAHRFSCFAPAADPEGATLDRDGHFRRGAFPGTGRRMELYAQAAPQLAAGAVEGLELDAAERAAVTHLVVTSCTGFSAPGIDLEIVRLCGLSTSVERTIIGFMGCYAAVNALKLARHIVRSEADARVLVVNVELCTLHVRETPALEELLSFCLWGDGAAAALVTGEARGLMLESFRTAVAPARRDLMTWDIRDDGFSMFLSGDVPSAIGEILRDGAGAITNGRDPAAIDLWAVHPGGRSVLDAVEHALGLSRAALAPSRGVLADNGNMSSATIMFVLRRMLEAAVPGLLGCGMAFGPGLTAETLMFRTLAA